MLGASDLVKRSSELARHNPETEAWARWYSGAWQEGVRRPGLADNRYRVYDSLSGTYLQADPKQVETWDSYGYAESSPTLMTDATGLESGPGDWLYEATGCGVIALWFYGCSYVRDVSAGVCYAVWLGVAAYAVARDYCNPIDDARSVGGWLKSWFTELLSGEDDPCTLVGVSLFSESNGYFDAVLDQCTGEYIYCVLPSGVVVDCASVLDGSDEPNEVCREHPEKCDPGDRLDATGTSPSRRP